AQDDLQSVQPMERAGNLAEHLRGRSPVACATGAGGAGQHSCQSPSLRRRRKRGASEQAIGITKGGRNSKIHGLVDKLCRPWVLILTPGNTADCTARHVSVCSTASPSCSVTRLMTATRSASLCARTAS